MPLSTVELTVNIDNPTGTNAIVDVIATLSGPLYEQVAPFREVGIQPITTTFLTGAGTLTLYATKGDADVVPAGRTYTITRVVRNEGVGLLATYTSIVEIDSDLGAAQNLSELVTPANTTVVYGVTALTATTPIVASGSTGAVALSHAATAVTPGAYTNTNLTVDAKGHITAAANGSGGSVVAAATALALGTVKIFGTPADAANPTVPVLEASGDIPASVIPALDYEALGAAAAVQASLNTEATTRATGDTSNATNLSTHAARTDNPHSVTAAQVSAVPASQVTGVGVVATGGFTLTVPATGTPALLATSNLFSVRQDVRASGSGQAAGLYVPWISGDSLPSIKAGSTNSSNNQFAVAAYSYGNVGVLGVSVGNIAIQAQAQNTVNPAILAQSYVAASNAVVRTLILNRENVTGTAGAGYGVGLAVTMNSATVSARETGLISVKWVTATDASRASQLDLSTYYTSTERVGLSLGSDSAGPLIGFLGTSPIAKPTITGAHGSNAALQSLLSALANLGLIVNSSS